MEDISRWRIYLGGGCVCSYGPQQSGAKQVLHPEAPEAPEAPEDDSFMGRQTQFMNRKNSTESDTPS